MAKEKAGVVITVTTTPPRGKNPPKTIDIYVNGGNPVRLNRGKGKASANAYNCLKWYLMGERSTTFEILLAPNQAAKNAKLELKMGANKKCPNPVSRTIGRSGIAGDSLYFWLE